MIVHQVAQGSAEWLALRAGIPTASQFHRVITPKKAERSGQFDDFVNDLVAERFMGRPLATADMPWMREGSEREPESAAYYSFVRGVELETVGLITTDDGKIGASPDRVVTGTRGLLELKNPKAHTHIGYLLGAGPDESYRVQLQGQLFVCECEWVDIMSYYPGMPEAVVRVARDEEFIKKLSALLYEAVEQVEARMAKLKADGYEPRVEEPEAQWITDADIAELESWSSIQGESQKGATV